MKFKNDYSATFTFLLKFKNSKKRPFKEKSLDTKKRVKCSPSSEKKNDTADCQGLEDKRSRTRMLTVSLDLTQMMDVKGLLAHSGWMELSNLEMLF